MRHILCCKNPLFYRSVHLPLFFQLLSLKARSGNCWKKIAVKNPLSNWETFWFHTFDFSDNLLHFFLLFADEVSHGFSWPQRDVTCYRLMVSRSVHVDSGQKFGFFWPAPGPVTNSILFCRLLKIKDRCKKRVFYRHKIEVCVSCFLRVSWDIFT